MTAASTYPDPFAAGPGTACRMTCKQVLGPCYTPTIDRKDISEGQDGLLLRLAFLVLDESCKPVQGARVDIWHSSPGGVYSGNEYPDDAKLKACTYSDPAAMAARWFRDWRDILAMAAHAGISFDAAGENLGRMELGSPPDPKDPLV